VRRHCWHHCVACHLSLHPKCRMASLCIRTNQHFGSRVGAHKLLLIYLFYSSCASNNAQFHCRCASNINQPVQALTATHTQNKIESCGVSICNGKQDSKSTSDPINSKVKNRMPYDKTKNTAKQLSSCGTVLGHFGGCSGAFQQGPSVRNILCSQHKNNNWIGHL